MTYNEDELLFKIYNIAGYDYDAPPRVQDSVRTGEGDGVCDDEGQRLSEGYNNPI